MPKISPGSRRGLRRLHTAFVERLEPRRLLSAAPGTPNSLMFHGDAARTGFNQNETVLTPANVSANFGQVWQSPVLDGHLYAAPIYMDNVTIGALGSGNAANHTGDGVVAGAGATVGVVFAATGGGSVYAIKAFDTNGPSGVAAGTILWKTFLGSPSASIDGNSIGVLGTPIIDAQANRMYVVASVHDYLLPAADPNHGTVIFEAFALDLSNGALISGWPVVINQAVLNAAGINQNQLVSPGTTIAFGGAGSGAADERGGLNLSADGSILYIPFASYGSSNGGWLINMKTGITNGVSNGQTPGIASAFSATAQPGTAVGNGGIWGGGGPAIDSTGNIFVSTGDNPDGTKQLPGSWGNSVLEFNPGSASNQTLSLTGTFTPWNYQTQDTIDTDLGGAAPVIIQMPGGSSNTLELLVTGGKQGNAYLLDAGNHLNNPGATPSSLVMRPPVVPPNQDPSLYDTNPSDPGAVRPYFSPPQVGPLNVFGPYSEVHGMVNFGRSRTTPSTFIGPDGSYYVVWTGSQKLTDSSTIPTAPGVVVTKIVATPGQNAYLQIAAQNTQTLSLPDASIVTANGTSNEIVWVVDEGVQRSDSLATGSFNNGSGTLYAYDALTMQPLWSSPYHQLDMGGKYNTIAVARGVAFVGTDRIQAFGLTTTTSIDDSVVGTGANQFQYVGAWSHTTPGTSTATMGTFQGTVSTDSTMGDTATMSFTGSQIKVYANEKSGYGSVAVSIDGGAPTTVALGAITTGSPNSQGAGNVLIFTSATLGPGTHTLTLTNTVNSTISLDRVEITPISSASALSVSVTEGNVSAVAGQPLQYTVNYHNAGSIVGGTGVNASGVVLTETVPANTTFNLANSTTGWVHGAGSTYTFSVGSLAAGDTGSVVFAVSVSGSIPGGTINLSDTVSITDAASDSGSGNRLTPIAGTTPMAFKLAIGQQPTNTRTGSAITPAVTVYVQDQFGHTFSSTSTVTLTLSSGSFAGGGNTVSIAASGGVATFSNLVINAVGNYTLAASDGALVGTVSGSFNVVSATQVRFTQQPVSATAGNALSSVNVTVEDALGNPVTGDSSTVTLLLNGGSFAGGSNTASAQAVNGVATFNSLVINAAGTYTLSASDSGLAGDTSNSFTISVASPAALAFTQQPAASVVGVPLSTVAVAVQDQFGNTILNDSSTVTVTLSSGVFSTGVNTATMSASAGIATFNNLTINQNGTYTLTATDGSLAQAVSNMFTIPAPFTVDDANYGTGVNQVNYGGTGPNTQGGTGWGTVFGTSLVGAYPPPVANGTVTNSTTANNAATIMFNGAQILFYAGYKNSRGYCAVSIDGGPETFIDLYANDGIGFCALAYTSPLLTPGLHTFKVRVATEVHDSHGGTTVSLDHFDILKGTSTITWQNPADIAYGTPLDATQLNATANVPGTFTYTPAAGTLLPAGQNQTLFVQFTPTDSADYFPAAASVSININKADPQVDWDDPESIFYGQQLTATQLNATANVPGTFDYNPGLGSILPTRSEYPLTAIFTPTDTADYNSVMVTSKIDIFPAMPTIVWSNPADIQLGTALGATQLNAVATFQNSPLSGTFSYSPPAGTILGLGQNQTLQVLFTPSDSTDFVLATATVHINVNPLTVVNTNDSGVGSLRQALLDAANLPGTTHTITFQIPAGPQTINLATALPATADPVVAILDSTQNVIVNSPAGAGTNSFAMITKTGAGLLALAGKNSLSGNLQVDGGRLRLAAGSGSSPAAGIAVTVDGSATLELAGTASNLSGGSSQPVNITNTSTATSGVEVSGTHQAAGKITGGGNLTIDAGADLTANAIVQGALVIGGTAGSSATLTIAPSDASGNPHAEAGGAAVGGPTAPAPQTPNSTAAASAGPIGAGPSTASITGSTAPSASPPAVGAPMFSSPATVFLANGQDSPDPNAATATSSGPSRRPSIGSLLESGGAANLSWMFADSRDNIDLRSTAARAAVDEALADADLFAAVDEGLLDLLAGISHAR